MRNVGFPKRYTDPSLNSQRVSAATTLLKLRFEYISNTLIVARSSEICEYDLCIVYFFLSNNIVMYQNQTFGTEELL